MKGLQLKPVRQGPQAVRPAGRTPIPAFSRTKSRPFRSGRNAACFSPIIPASKQLHTQVTRAVSLDTPTEVQTSTAEESSQYVWTKNWWPLIPVKSLDPKRPKAMTVLGVQLVVWKDGEGQWRVFNDACPHRLAPLSEGRVEADGTLLCSYHAWRFNGEGKCTTIPQSITPEAEATARSSKRSCAVAFPVKEEVGLVWVWPDESDTRWIESAASPAIVSNLLKQRYEENGSLMWYMRDLPYSYEVLIENGTDPAHLPVSHHGVSPALSRYKAGAMRMDHTPDNLQLDVFDTPVPATVDVAYNAPSGKDAIIRFTAPLFIQLPGIGDKSWVFCTVLYAIPVAPGKSRVISVDVLNLEAIGPSGLPGVFTRWMISRVMNPVTNHRTKNRILDGDSVFLNMQGTTLQQQHQGDWKSAYYLAAPCDRALATARSWIDQVGHPFPVETQDTAGPIDRRTLLDRYHTHTADCPDCLAAYKRLSSMMTVVKFVAAACFLGACAVVGNVGLTGLVKNAAPFITTAGQWVAGLLAAAAWCVTGWTAKLEAAQSEFVFTDWVHADKD